MKEKPTLNEIKERIDAINKKIEDCFYPNQFTLNGCIVEMTKEIEQLQSQCPHEFKNGYCIYCYKGEK